MNYYYLLVSTIMITHVEMNNARNKGHAGIVNQYLK